MGDGVAVTRDTAGATATLAGGADAAVRLLVGRLGPNHTPASVGVTGDATLDAL